MGTIPPTSESNGGEGRLKWHGGSNPAEGRDSALQVSNKTQMISNSVTFSSDKHE